MRIPVVLALGRDRVAVPTGVDVISVGRWWALRMDVADPPGQAQVTRFERLQAELCQQHPVLPVRFGWRPTPAVLRTLLRERQAVLDAAVETLVGQGGTGDLPHGLAAAAMGLHEGEVPSVGIAAA